MVWNNSVSNQDGAKISKSLTKSIQWFYMPSKCVIKFHIIKLQCFIESKKITIFLKNLNRNCNTFRWKMKIIFRTSKRRLKDVLFYWDKRTNFERTKDFYFRSRTDWDHQHTYFPVNIAKLLRTIFLKNTSCSLNFSEILSDNRILWTSLGKKLIFFIFFVPLLWFVS